MTSQELRNLNEFFWPSDAARPVNLYGIFDCARRPEVYDAVQRSYREKCCLFAGKLDLELERAAPHLLELGAKDSLTEFLLLHGWEDAWGIFIESDAPFWELRRHLRTFLRVKSEGGLFLLFRYYDPRVINTYLPTCTAAELKLIFGSEIKRLIACSPKAGVALSYSLGDGRLHMESLELTR